MDAHFPHKPKKPLKRPDAGENKGKERPEGTTGKTKKEVG
jgi:hypothetical protein